MAPARAQLPFRFGLRRRLDGDRREERGVERVLGGAFSHALVLHWLLCMFSTGHLAVLPCREPLILIKYVIKGKSVRSSGI
jgi:hypothetical protein